MSIFEYDDEREMKLIRQAEREMGWEEGHADGWRAGHDEGLSAGLAEGHIAGVAEGRAEGRAKGRAEGIDAFISFCKEINITKEEIVSQLISKFELSHTDAIAHLEKTKRNADY